MKKSELKAILLAIAVISFSVWVGIDMWQLKQKPKQPRYVILKTYVAYGKVPRDTAVVTKCFEKWIGYRAIWNGKIYFISGTTGDNPFYPDLIIFSGNENIKIYNKRLIPVFRSGVINDLIVDKENGLRYTCIINER